MTPTALYRHFDAAGNLLYVGISLSPFTRTRQHKQRAPWFIEVSRIEVEWFGTRGDAEQAEWVAIKSEHPLHNRTYAYREPMPIEQFLVLNAAHGEIKPAPEPPAAVFVDRAKRSAIQRREEMRVNIAETIASFPLVI
jgi:hypothetical protein